MSTPKHKGLGDVNDIRGPLEAIPICAVLGAFLFYALMNRGFTGAFVGGCIGALIGQCIQWLVQTVKSRKYVRET